MKILMWLVFGAVSYMVLGLLCEAIKTRKGRK